MCVSDYKFSAPPISARDNCKIVILIIHNHNTEKNASMFQITILPSTSKKIMEKGKENGEDDNKSTFEQRSSLRPS